MAYKTVGISEKAYKILSRRKKKRQSFSDVILNMDKKLREKSNIMKFAGIWSEETAERVKALLKKEREALAIEEEVRVKMDK
jgi:predicted CopG family antitoxin